MEQESDQSMKLNPSEEQTVLRQYLAGETCRRAVTQYYMDGVGIPCGGLANCRPCDVCRTRAHVPVYILYKFS